MIGFFLARRLQRIRQRRFLFVRIEYCNPLGVHTGWDIVGVFMGGREVHLGSNLILDVALDQAERYANARWDAFGQPLGDAG